MSLLASEQALPRRSPRTPDPSGRACLQAISLPTTQQATWRANLVSLYISRRLVQTFLGGKIWLKCGCGNRRRKRFRLDGNLLTLVFAQIGLLQGVQLKFRDEHDPRAYDMRVLGRCRFTWCTHLDGGYVFAQTSRNKRFSLAFILFQIIHLFIRPINVHTCNWVSVAVGDLHLWTKKGRQIVW